MKRGGQAAGSEQSAIRGAPGAFMSAPRGRRDEGKRNYVNTFSFCFVFLWGVLLLSPSTHHVNNVSPFKNFFFLYTVSITFNYMCTFKLLTVQRSKCSKYLHVHNIYIYKKVTQFVLFCAKCFSKL